MFIILSGIFIGMTAAAFQLIGHRVASTKNKDIAELIAGADDGMKAALAVYTAQVIQWEVVGPGAYKHGYMMAI